MNQDNNSRRRWQMVNVALHKNEKVLIKDMSFEDVDIIDLISSYALASYKVTFSFNKKADSYILAVTMTEDDHEDSNKTFTVFHAQLERLFCTLQHMKAKAADGQSFDYLFNPYRDNDW